MIRATPMPSNAELVAYLDGELSPSDSVRLGQRIAAEPDVAARLALLTRGGRPFRDAFDPMLSDAPTERLDAILAAALTRPPRVTRRWFNPATWPTQAAAALVLLGVGAAVGHLVPAPRGAVQTLSVADDADDWRQTVTQYLSLYTGETLAAIPGGAADRKAELANAGNRLGLTLTPTRLTLPDLTLKRADLYDYDGKALAFLAYLDPASGPVALCITGAIGDAPRTIEQRHGMTVVSWSRGQHSFMLIGRDSTDRLAALATTVASRFEEGGG